MATIAEKEIVPGSYDATTNTMRCRVRIDAVDHFRDCGNCPPTPAERVAVLDAVATNVLEHVETIDSEEAVEDYKGVGDWNSLPEGETKQRRAQAAAREIIRLAIRGKGLQTDPRCRPEALMHFMECRSLNAQVIKNIAGTPATIAAYLNLAGPGPGTVYTLFRQYLNDLEAVAPEFSTLITFMDTAETPIEADE